MYECEGNSFTYSRNDIMLNTQEFGDYLQSVGLKDFVGVPCSYLAPLINYAINIKSFIMSNNEGDAIAIASGISLCRHQRYLSYNSSLNNHLQSTATNLAAINSSSIDVSSTKVFNEKIKLCNSEYKNQMPTTQEIHKFPTLPQKTTSQAYGVVLMQNSGLSNALSPLTSLNYPFKIPILGFVSLRGERDENDINTDEPQHELLGIITDKLLEICKIKYAFLDSNISLAKTQVDQALSYLEQGESFFFIVRDKTFSKVSLADEHSVVANIKRLPLRKYVREHVSSEEVLASDYTQNQTSSVRMNESVNKIIDKQSTFFKHIDFSKKKNNQVYPNKDSELSEFTCKTPTRLQALTVLHNLAKVSNTLLLATTGKCGRELYEINDSPNQLYMVGSMGCVSSLSLGIALKSKQKVIAIDGDSALLMRLGALSTNAYYTKDQNNFCHILLDNESHDSTGGQFNLSPFVDFCSIAKSCGYVHVYEAKSLKEFETYIKVFVNQQLSIDKKHSTCEGIAEVEVPKESIGQHCNSNNRDSRKGAWFIYLKIQKGSKENLGRPKITPQEVAQRLSEYIQGNSNEF